MSKMHFPVLFNALIHKVHIFYVKYVFCAYFLHTKDASQNPEKHISCLEAVFWSASKFQSIRLICCETMPNKFLPHLVFSGAIYFPLCLLPLVPFCSLQFWRGQCCSSFRILMIDWDQTIYPGIYKRLMTDATDETWPTLLYPFSQLSIS